MREKQKGYGCCAPFKWWFCFNVNNINIVYLYFCFLRSVESTDEKTGRSSTVDLKPRGRDIDITERNKAEFVQLMTDRKGMHKNTQYLTHIHKHKSMHNSMHTHMHKRMHS